MKYALPLFFALALASTGCGGPTPPPEGAHEHGGPQAGPQGHDDHAANPEHEGHKDLKGPVAEFHHILAPIWHGPEAERSGKACQQAQAMHDKAVAAESAPVNEGRDLEKYKAAAKDLTAAVDRMTAECKKPTQEGVDKELTAVHEAFHKIAELSGPQVQTEGHGEHGGEHKH